MSWTVNELRKDRSLYLCFQSVDVGLVCFEYVCLLCVSGDVCLCVCEDGFMSVRFVSVSIIKECMSFQSLEEFVFDAFE